MSTIANAVFTVLKEGIYDVWAGNEVTDKRSLSLLNVLELGKTVFTATSIERNLDADLYSVYGKTPAMRVVADSAIISARNLKISEDGNVIRDTAIEKGHMKFDVVITTNTTHEQLLHCLYCVIASRFMHAQLYPYVIKKECVVTAPNNLKKPRTWYLEAEDGRTYTFKPTFSVSADVPYQNTTMFDVIIDADNFVETTTEV